MEHISLNARMTETKMTTHSFTMKENKRNSGSGKKRDHHVLPSSDNASIREVSGNDAQFEEEHDNEVQIIAVIPPNDNEIPTIDAEPEEKSELNGNHWPSATQNQLDPEHQLLSNCDGVECNNHSMGCSNCGDNMELRVLHMELDMIKLSHKTGAVRNSQTASTSSS